MRWQRLWVAMLVPGGLALGHEASCSVARSRTADTAGWLSHGCLLVLAVVGVSLAALAMAAAFSAGRRGHPAAPRTSTSAVTQAGIFLLVEVGEQVTSGVSVASTMGERTEWLGLAAHAVVAFTIAIVMRAVAAIGAWRAKTAEARPRYRKAVATTMVLLWTPVINVEMSAACRRGPPLLTLT